MAKSARKSKSKRRRYSPRKYRSTAEAPRLYIEHLKDVHYHNAHQKLGFWGVGDPPIKIYTSSFSSKDGRIILYEDMDEYGNPVLRVRQKVRGMSLAHGSKADLLSGVHAEIYIDDIRFPLHIKLNRGAIREEWVVNDENVQATGPEPNCYIHLTPEIVSEKL